MALVSFSLMSGGARADSLAGWWKFDEGSGDIAYDSAGNNNGRLGALEGADSRDPAWVEGKINGALDFDVDAEEEDSVSLSPIGALVTDTVTISAWIRADDVSAGLHPIVAQYKHDGDDYYGYLLYLSGDEPRFFLGGAGRAEATGISINTGDWYHLTGTNDGNGLKIYVNGVEEGTISSSGYTGINHDPYIGYDGDGSYFDGVIDDVRVYNYALDMFEIWDAMSGDASRFCVKNSSGETVAWFDSFGNLFLKGEKLTTAEDPIPAGSFIIKDSEDVPVAYIDNEGNLWIEGEELGGGCDPEGDAFIIRNSSDTNVSYIDFANGDLCLTGELYQNPEQ